MKSIGVVRKLDQLGRFVIPKEMRITRKITHNDSLEIFVEGNTIILKKYEPCCIFCGEAKDAKYFSGKYICLSCKDKLIEAKL